MKFRSSEKFTKIGKDVHFLRKLCQKKELKLDFYTYSYMYSFYFPDVSLSNMLGRDVSHHHCISLQIWPFSSG